jgi:hypothetical protein
MSAVELRTHQSLLYIDGAFMPATGGATFEVINPSNDKVRSSDFMKCSHLPRPALPVP